MSKRSWIIRSLCLFFMAVVAPLAAFQPDPNQPDKKGFDKKGGPGGFGADVKPRRKLVEQFDKDGDGRLNAEERQAAREFIKKQPGGGKGGFGKGKGGFGKGGGETAKPGPKVAPADVKSFPNAKLYDPTVLRTIFIEFENKKDWEAELADFYHTDVEVPALVIVDGKNYPDVGVRFRGNSSYFMVPTGFKHSFNLSFDFVNNKQRLYDYKTLNLLNCNEDPTLLHSVLFCAISRQYIPAPQANLVKVVINGESWGIFANQQQFNKEFLQENYQTTKGARWKVPGHPGAASSGLSYLGDKIDEYKRHYEIKSKEDEKDWQALIELCRVLNQTPPDKLEAALSPILDVDNALWYIALDNALINDDGYWTRASDYNLYRDPKGRFHIIQTDTNETLQPMGFGGPKGGGGFGKGPKDGKGGGSGYALDPLIGLNSTRAPLRSKLLAVPAWREKYLKNVHRIANESLDWKKLGPLVSQYRALIEKEVELDTRKLSSLAEFRNSTTDAPPAEGAGSRYSIRAFADGRRSYLLNHVEIKKAIGE
jgi:hypothetical protein